MCVLVPKDYLQFAYTKAICELAYVRPCSKGLIKDCSRKWACLSFLTAERRHVCITSERSHVAPLVYILVRVLRRIHQSCSIFVVPVVTWMIFVFYTCCGFDGVTMHVWSMNVTWVHLYCCLLMSVVITYLGFSVWYQIHTLQTWLFVNCTAARKKVQDDISYKHYTHW